MSRISRPGASDPTAAGASGWADPTCSQMYTSVRRAANAALRGGLGNAAIWDGSNPLNATVQVLKGSYGPIWTMKCAKMCKRSNRIMPSAPPEQSDRYCLLCLQCSAARRRRQLSARLVAWHVRRFMFKAQSCSAVGMGCTRTGRGLSASRGPCRRALGATLTASSRGHDAG